MQYARVLGWAGEHDSSLEEAGKLEENDRLDGHALINLASLYFEENEYKSGLSALRKAVERGYRNINTLRKYGEFAPLRVMPEFGELMKELEEIIVKEKKS